MRIVSTPIGEILPTKINFGCGNNFLKDYLNIDVCIPMIIHEEDHLFVYEGELLNPQSLPNDYFDSIKAQMVFEHIHPDVIPTVIYTMSCILKVGGEVHVTVPNFEYFIKNYPVSSSKGLNIQKLQFLREAMFQLLDPVFKSDYSTSHRGHQSLWTLEIAKFWFESEGFLIKKSTTNNLILSFTAVKKDKFSSFIKHTQKGEK